MKSVWKYIAGFSLAIVIIFAFFISPYGKTVLLKVNRAKWERQNITHYRFNLTINCFCTYPDLSPMTIEVRNGQIVSATDVNGQIIPVPEEWDSAGDTMEDLFAMIEDTQKTANKLSIKYDAVYGFPTFIYINQDVRIAGTENEISFSVSNFEVLP